MCPTIWFYLAEIYRIQDDLGGDVTLSALAERMGVSLQAASRMIRRMVEEGHLIHEPYRGVRLTPQGERIALEVIRRHRILEVFLVKVMGFGWDEAHEMCESLERGMTDPLIERMDQMAGFPTRCPHGEPIPRNGQMPRLDDRPMTAWPLAERGQVSRVKTHDPEKLRYLAGASLMPGTPVTITDRSPFDGPLHVECAGQRFVLGSQLAAEIYVEKPTGAG